MVRKVRVKGFGLFLGNQLADLNTLNATKLPRLTQLELKANKLTSTAGVHIVELKKLYLGDNMITKIEDLGRLRNLMILHLRNNNLSNLDGFTENLRQLQYLNLRYWLLNFVRICSFRVKSFV